MGLAPADIAARQAAAAKKTYTYEDYRKLPEGAPYQLIGGMLNCKIAGPVKKCYNFSTNKCKMKKLIRGEQKWLVQPYITRSPRADSPTKIT